MLGPRVPLLEQVPLLALRPTAQFIRKRAYEKLSFGEVSSP